MFKNKRIFSVFIGAMLAIIVPMALSSASMANIRSSSDSLALIESACPAGAGQYQELTELKEKIAAAGTLDQARALALVPTDEALGALNNASAMLPFSDDLRSAATRLSDARERILVASSQEQVADEFNGMMLAGLDSDHAARVNVGSGSCDYSSGEMIAIVIGLILGIIPGLILLVVLC